MNSVTRRDFMKGAALAAAASFTRLSPAQPVADRVPPTPSPEGPPRLRWLEGKTWSQHPGATWGIPWPRGAHRPGTAFKLTNGGGASIPMQTWETATWPDGSLKWTAHAIPASAGGAGDLVLAPGDPAPPSHPVAVQEREGEVILSNGTVRCVIPKTGGVQIASLTRGGRDTLLAGRLVAMSQASPHLEKAIAPEKFGAVTESVAVEQTGPVRAVVRIGGSHRGESGRQWLHFTLRVYLHADSDAIRLTHTFIFDGDENRDFLRGLGVRFEVPMVDELHNRHVRFVGDGAGQWAEAVRGITGLRRDPGSAVRAAQIAGRATPPLGEWERRVSSRLELIPAWTDYSLTQLSANGFSIRKRTGENHAWIDADEGHRSSGVGYIGGVSGGVAFGMRDFWQLHPTQLDIRGAASERAEVTLWMWAPAAPPMDLRFYHDGMGMDTFPEQIEGLEITYEDYEPGFGTPHGVARSTDLTLHALAATPAREALDGIARAVAVPPQLVARVEDYLGAGVFGALWSPVDRGTPEKAAIEDRLAWSIDFYRRQVDQRHWYGFWNYGDVMHTYDADRHVWRYDVGGYAWDNSELSPDLWLWYSFLRGGEAPAFRLAEAMTRHNRDVDIYHAGRFAGLGTRHNVMHWGCSAKQLRISTAAYRRFHYFLTGDERTGDVLSEVAEADRRLEEFNPVRKLGRERARAERTHIGVGTDWGSAAANWLTDWERTGEEKYRDWLVGAMRTIGAAEHGFFTSAFAFDPETKKLTVPEHARISVSHLSAVFGLVEICAELVELFDVPEFKEAWLQYCTLYNAPPAQQEAALGRSPRGAGLRVAHSRLTAYAAASRNDTELAKRAWSEFSVVEWGPPPTLETVHLEGPEVLNPVDEAVWVSTNDASQWGLAAIQNLALAGARL